MNTFKNAVAEVRRTLGRLIIFDTSINAILVFLIAFLLLSFFNLPLIYPTAIAAAYFVYVLRRRLRMSKVRIVEQKYKNLNEKFRTAAEYASEDNPVVKELHSEVISDLQNVEEAAFVNEKRIYVKSLAVIALCFIILLLSPFTFGVLTFNVNFVDNPSEDASVAGSSGSGSSTIKFAVGTHDTGLRKVSDDIYGEPTIAKLGDEEVKIRIKPSGTELSIREIQEADLPDFSESYPTEIQAVASESYEETIPKEDLELVKNYFNELAKG